MKQRLIGAAVLVALAVIFVPMLLDAPEPTATPAGSISLDIPPAPGAPLQTREIPLNLPRPDASTPAAVDDTDRVVTVDADSAPRVDALADARPMTRADTAGTSTAAPSAPSAIPAPSSTAATAPATPPSSASASSATPAKPVAAAPIAAPPKPEPAAVATAPASAGRFVVNLGSFGNLANAEALRARLSKRGVSVMVETITLDGKPAKRLRAGPYRSRAEAESAQLTLAKAEPGNAFSVAELDSPAGTPAPTAASAMGAFAVQVGALKDEAEANALRDRLRKAGFTAYVARAQTDAGLLWRVRAGPELDRARAEAVRAQLKQRLQLDGLVVAHP